MLTDVVYGKRVPSADIPVSTCDRCGANLPSAQLRLEWTGLYTCVGNANGAHNCWDYKHPSLDFQAPIDHSLLRANPRQPREGFTSAPMTYDQLVAMLRKKPL